MHRHLLRLLRQVWRLPKVALKRLVTGLLRVVLLANRPARLARSGFVLPTTVLLTLMVVLTATALTYRTFTRSDMAISQREQQVITNAATPAIDRAKAKIEFLFRTDPRFPAGVPSSDVLADLMLPNLDPSVDFAGYTGRVTPLPGGNNNDPYTLPGETRVDINNDGFVDNAWSFRSDNDETVVYSILVDDRVTAGETDDLLRRPYVNETIDITSPNTENKANALITRTGPLATTEALPQCQGAIAEGGWQLVTQGNNSVLQKNFQINAFVANNNEANRTFDTLEFQQSRVASRASKWGAWFRYDLEIHPGQDFKWNGAMHTDGNFVLDGLIEPFMVSSQNSCLYTREASEITMSEFNNDGEAGINLGNAEAGQVGDFQGQVIVAKTDGDEYTNATLNVHVFNTANTAPNEQGLTQNNDSITQRNSRPSDVAMNPLLLFTQEDESHINPTTWDRNANWDGGNFTLPNRERILNEEIARPFVDDLYRADDRWGPKPRYSEAPSLDLASEVNDAVVVGDRIENRGELTAPGDGLDGYWERRAIGTGLRLIVGERLELGNNNDWGHDPTNGVAADGDPLYPHADLKADLPGNTAVSGGNLEHLHRKSLRDNLAAVQGMAIYHYDGGGMATNGEFPLACYALTAHPGTRGSLIKSRTFAQWESEGVKTDFFNGQGTNGWEFRYHDDFDTPGEFRVQVGPTNPLGIALRNLAYFAGDPNGGAPSFRPIQDNNVHPYPQQAMWGDFSNLRRIIDDGGLETANAFDALSPADKATVHTAACTLGLLAYNMQKELEDYELLGETNFANLTSVSQRFNNLVGRIAQYMRNLTIPPGNAYNIGNRSVFDEMQALGIDRNAWINRRIVNIIRNQQARRDEAGNLSLDPNGRLAVVNDAGAELIDGVPILDAAGNIVGVETPYDGNAATLTYLGQQADTYLIDNFLADNGVRPGGAAEYFNSITFAQWQTLFPYGTGNINQADAQLFVDFANRVNKIYSLIRDRDLGFKVGQTTKTIDEGGGTTLPWDPDTGYLVTLSYGTVNVAISLKTQCDPNVFRAVLPGGEGGNNNVGVAGLVGCSQRNEMPVRFPSLYYLFPLEDHSHIGADYHLQPEEEEYIAQGYISDQNSASSRFRRVRRPADTTERAIIEGVNYIAAVPKPSTNVDTTWVTPAVTAAALTNPNELAQAFRVNICGRQTDCFDPDTGLPRASGTGAPTGIRLSFLDKGMYDGREFLNARVLDIDLDALTRDPVTAGRDRWISANRDNNAEGVVYAFREDAVREDEIVRPRNSDATTVATCSAFRGRTGADTRIFQLEINDDCLVSIDPNDPQDPPLTDKRISLKPVDFLPDPQRRVHGFRLRTASGTPADFSGGDPATGRQVGMTFVSDNSVYIMGNFNPHSSDGTVNAGSLLEEFTQTITDRDFDFNDFYGRRTDLNTARFANLAVDHWRPVEILSDAIYILSQNFVDGAVSDSFVSTGGTSPSSYTNQPRPIGGGAIANWVQEAGIDAPAPSPVFVDRNGTYYFEQANGTVVPFFAQFTANNQWTRVQDGKTLVTAPDSTYVNAVFVSGISPKRPNQGYGGLQNFPRFLENWRDRDLFIQGSFIQLNFSTANTAPYEQEALEPGGIPDTAELIRYYDAPRRRWGYDVGLLYVPCAPASCRFANIGAPRSEYYRELPANDPYIVNLRCARRRNDDGFERVMDDMCPA